MLGGAYDDIFCSQGCVVMACGVRQDARGGRPIVRLSRCRFMTLGEKFAVFLMMRFFIFYFHD